MEATSIIELSFQRRFLCFFVFAFVETPLRPIDGRGPSVVVVLIWLLARRFGVVGIPKKREARRDSTAVDLAIMRDHAVATCQRQGVVLSQFIHTSRHQLHFQRGTGILSAIIRGVHSRSFPTTCELRPPASDSARSQRHPLNGMLSVG